MLHLCSNEESDYSERNTCKTEVFRSSGGVLRKKVFFKMLYSQEAPLLEETPVNSAKFLRTPFL